MKLRKGKLGEIEKIVNCADSAFKPERDINFSFKSSVPHVYENKNVDYSTIHFVAEDKNGEFKSVVGNLISEIVVDNHPFKFSRVGTVGTVPEFRGQGLMKSLMNQLDNENKNENVVFSVLCGKRNRYRNFGYERAGWTSWFTFDKDQWKYLKKDDNISVKPYLNQDLKLIYDIYRNKEKFTLRDFSSFELSLNNSKRKLFTIFLEDKIIGYVSIKGNVICELVLQHEKFAESVMQYILYNNIVDFEINKYNDKTILVYINILQENLYKQFEKMSEYKNLVEEKSYKIYDMQNFINLLYKINNKNYDEQITETYKIENEIYSFKQIGGELIIIESNDNPQFDFETREEFIRFVLGSVAIKNIYSKIFPLFFDINNVDNF